MRCDSVERRPPTVGVIIDLQARTGDPVAPNHTPCSMHSFTSLVCAPQKIINCALFDVMRARVFELSSQNSIWLLVGWDFWANICRCLHFSQRSVQKHRQSQFSWLFCVRHTERNSCRLPNFSDWVTENHENAPREREEEENHMKKDCSRHWDCTMCRKKVRSKQEN